jgi:hypothetical protein
MRIDRYKFGDNYTLEHLPEWSCPHCFAGYLASEKRTITIEEAADSLRSQSNPQHEPEWDYGHFTGRLICSNKKCEELVLVSGDTKVGYYDVDFEGAGAINAWFLTPKYFTVPPRLFPLQPFYPKSVLTPLEKSFALFWYDAASCANKIRTVVEAIMDNKKVKKFVREKGGLRQLTLHSRIKEFDKKHPKAAHYLLAIKWIGNLGSHSDDQKLKKAHLIKAFELLSAALDHIYDDHAVKLDRYAAAVNREKGIPKPKVIKKAGFKIYRDTSLS